MWVSRFLFLTLICIVSVNGEDLNCPPSTSKTTHARLKSSLLCDYDPTIRPVVNYQNATSLSFRLVLKYFTYDTVTSTLGINAWMRLLWTDQHLTWNPDDYESMDSIILYTSEIWTPDLAVYNRATQGGDPTVLDENKMKCSVTYRGTVTCEPSIHIDTLCVPDLRMYPFDTQSCSLRMGSWIHKGEELDLRLLKNLILLNSVEDNGEWNITSYTQTKFKGEYQDVTYPSIEIIFNIERLAGAHVASVFIPSIVLFTRDSLLLSTFAVLFTVGFKVLMKRESPPPEWMRNIVAIAVATLPGQYILLDDYSVRGIASAKGEEDGAGIIDEEQNKTEDWKIFAKILDILLLWVYGIVYLVMSLKFMP